MDTERSLPDAPGRSQWDAGGVDIIRGLQEQDWDGWLRLWEGYLGFYRAEVPDDTTRGTFERLTGEVDGMFGLVAVDDGGDHMGLAHCLVHPTTWSRRPYCYLEDLFVAPAARGGETGRALLEEAKRAADERGAGRLYWHTQVYNGRARSLYDQVGRPTSFMVYEL
jgi:GNAT superfamily N-acetyltransferase